MNNIITEFINNQGIIAYLVIGIICCLLLYVLLDLIVLAIYYTYVSYLFVKALIKGELKIIEKIRNVIIRFRCAFTLIRNERYLLITQNMRDGIEYSGNVTADSAEYLMTIVTAQLKDSLFDDVATESIVDKAKEIINHGQSGI